MTPSSATVPWPAALLLPPDPLGRPRPCTLADAVLLDTEAHIGYFHAEYGLKREKSYRIWVGADEAYLSEGEDARDGAPPFRVLYFGKFIPLHGVESIVRAAKLLEAEPDFRFEMIGGGQERPRAEALAASLGVGNIEWGPRVAGAGALRERIRAADVCLGILGASDKAAGDPDQGLHRAGHGQPLLTRDSAAARSCWFRGSTRCCVPPATRTISRVESWPCAAIRPCAGG